VMPFVVVPDPRPARKLDVAALRQTALGGPAARPSPRRTLPAPARQASLF